jgi:carbamoylphosphate synthase small subunit
VQAAKLCLRCLKHEHLEDSRSLRRVATNLQSSMNPPQILYVDAYDSFSNNIVTLLKTSIAADVHCVKIDDPDLLENQTSLGDYLSKFDAVVIGPGPGNPTLRTDVGWIDQVWKLSDTQLLPIFGICLGFQSLCNAFGGKVRTYAMLRSSWLMWIGPSISRATTWSCSTSKP